MIEWLYEPFTSITARHLFSIWVLLFVLQVTLAAILQKFDLIDFDDPLEELDGYSLSMLVLIAGVVIPMGEEVLFRIIPILIADAMSLSIVVTAIVGTVIWTAMHGKRAIFVAITAPIYLKLALGGLFVPMIALHMFNNTVASVLYKLTQYVGSENDK